jgi:hypothetical protein
MAKAAQQPRVEERREQEPVDTLVPDPQVAAELGGLTRMALHRWTHDPTLDFPPAIKIRGRNFRSRRLLEAFKERVLRKAMATRKAG